MSKYIAIDIGASSGRAIVGDLETNVSLEEINRFTIEILKENQDRLDLNKLISDILKSVEIATSKYDDIKSIGIDTWAVDSVALDSDGNPVELPMFYRDSSFVRELSEYGAANNLYDVYSKTGIQIQPFNTFFQMNKLEENYDVSKIDSMLLLPDYISYVLCGTKNLEFTNATATQCLDAKTSEVINENFKLFPKLNDERHLGNLKAEYSNGQDIEVIAVASHDTASAHAAIPNVDENTVFISSGTWTLLGINVETPVTSYDAFEANFSNEGSYNKTYRFQKNIMGLWMIVNIAKENGITDFAKLADDSSKATCQTLIDVNDGRFMNPAKMTDEVVNYCQDHGLDVPTTLVDITRVVYRSLALACKNAIEEIENILSREVKKVVIVGGGAKAQFLNEEIMNFSKKDIYAFPYECSALGNILVQAVETGKFNSIDEAQSFVGEHLEFKKIGE